MARMYFPVKCFYPEFIRFETDQFEKYLFYSEENLKNEVNSLEKRYKDELKDIQDRKINGDHDPEFEDTIIDYYADSFWMVDKKFVQYHRYSSLILLYSFLELKLKESCNRYSNRHNLDYSINDLNGRGDMEKVKIFLKKSVKFEELDPQWEFLDNLRVLRNIIVHKNGIIKEDSKEYKRMSAYGSNWFLIEQESNSSYYLIVLNNENFFKEILINIRSLFVKLAELEMSRFLVDKNDVMESRKNG